MKRLVVGILAHVDSGKTTLSEGILYTAGEIRTLGRVDHGNAFLDTNTIERERGITIFSKQAVVRLKDTEFTLLDTPGHVDFSAETERTLSVLDCAILVISGTDGVQSHTETLWRLLKQHSIPTFLFINKMDLSDRTPEDIIEELCKKLDDGCVNFSEEFIENAAMCDEELMNIYLEQETLSEYAIGNAIARRGIFPCFFGSALKLDGVREFLEGLEQYTFAPNTAEEFGAKIYKISADERGQRLTHLKVTGGILKVKDLIGKNDSAEKVNELRVYSGEKFQNIREAFPGMVCAVVGPSETYAGQGLGTEQNSSALTLEPVFTYCVKLPQGADLHSAVNDLRRLEEEETQLHIIWNEQLREIHIQLMGEVQMEVLKRIIAERFHLDVTFEKGSIIYKETIADTVEGVGHYEPLRHYAEVHLLMKPAKRGSGLIFSAKCSEDKLERNWQRLILTHLAEKTHIGVLTGSPITDMKITLVAGKAHAKHTEGGDFRQATYRAVRQGLMQAKSVLLEPWYDFTLYLPTLSVGRAMTDIQQMGGSFSAPETNGDFSVITGSASVAAMYGYHREVIAYTHGTGRLVCTLKGYEPCKNQEEIIEQIGYQSESDTENPADSVFCSHGAGFTVKWNEVHDYMHLEGVQLQENVLKETNLPRRMPSNGAFIDDEELMRIFEQTYGKIQRKTPNTMHTPKNEPTYKKIYKKPKQKSGEHYLLVDGYNIIFAWEDLKTAASDSLDLARTLLTNRLCAYRAMRNTEVIIVFDAYKVKGNIGSIEQIHNVSVVYTKEAETADSYIEKVTRELGKKHDVRVATSDYLEQLIILGSGALRISANELLEEVSAAEAEIREFLTEK